MPPDFTTLPKYSSYKDILACYPTEDAFLDAFCVDMPREIRAIIEDTMNPALLQIWLQRRLIRLQVQTVELLEALATDPNSAPLP